ncbi:DUF6708 domain-containing protein [Salinisphaera sp. Q1T1-3]|uniref:DUF6708 domain-containing protein n=1 Tax=Salinisphaera sp. Q1T1-3 TaxID=2321229 RepID=UPI0011C4994E|nr:DUF6708 domain-containing protein [Salinisphaera sp. Q1T1-3]
MSQAPKLTPKNRFWEEDLPDRSEPVDTDREKPALYGDLNLLSDQYLELSRAENRMRGIGIVVSIIGFVFFLVGIYVIWPPNVMVGPGDTFMLSALVIWLMAPLLPVLAILPLRLDLALPADEPVRFNRHTGKVYVYSFKHNHNPFGRWRPVTKVFDWQTIEAEITKQVGSTGRVVMVRYGLDLASCKPGTNEVVDRFTLKGGLWTTAELHRIWGYVRAYMNEGVDAVPSYKPRKQIVSLHQSFVYWFAFIDWTEAGREYRAKIGPFWSLIHILILPLMPLFIPMVFGHYIATKFAPEPRWPADIEAESRSGEPV